MKGELRLYRPWRFTSCVTSSRSRTREAFPTIAPYVLPELVVTFQKHYPEVTLEIIEDVTDGITRRIEAGELDVALASTCQQSPTLRRESLGNEPLLALVPEGHPLAKKTLVELDD